MRNATTRAAVATIAAAEMAAITAATAAAHAATAARAAVARAAVAAAYKEQLPHTQSTACGFTVRRRQRASAVTW